MDSALIGLFAETSVHAGAGRGMGVVDLPVFREACTDYPVIVGSSLKGALRDKAVRTLPDKVMVHFGEPNRAGDLVVSDARLLLLPVRSLTTSFRWVTCPHLIERFVRDLRRSGVDDRYEAAIDLELGTALATQGGDLFLEERHFKVVGEPDGRLATDIKRLLLHPETKKRIDGKLVVLNDDDFNWFAKYGLAIQARNVLEDKSKKSKNLWYEETLPPETVMYALIGARQNGGLDYLDKLFPKADQYLQVGGNETVGHGWFAVSVVPSGEGARN